MLATNRADWTAQYVAAVTAGNTHSGYWGHDDIRTALGDETGRRCAYCEAHVGHVAYEHVEHMKPKMTFPELSHAWNNLTSACPRCNINKGHYYVEGQAVLNPYEDEPDKHLHFIGNIIAPRSGSTRGEITILKLRLDRLDLTNARLVRLNKILGMVLRWREHSGVMKELMAEAIHLDADQGEFSAAVRSFLNALDFPGPVSPASDPATT